MENLEPQIDLTNKLHNHKPREKKTRRRFFLAGKIAVIIIAAIILAGIVFAYRSISSAENKIVDKENKSSFFKQLQTLITSPSKKLQGEDQDRVNLLLLGMGGPGHSGGIYLTDTIIIVSFKPSTKEVAMISIPRDLVVEIPGQYGYKKINGAYSFGTTSNYQGGGIALAKKVIEDVTGQTMHYWATVDFEGFRKIVDTLEGVEICVDQAFVDTEFPDYNLGYQTISFEKGCQIMDGEKALQYARSRKGNAGEGSDFARSKRQQKVIAAVKEKALSFGTLTSPSKISEILESLGDHVKTNTELWEMANVSKLLKDVETEDIVTRVLDNSSNGILHSEISSETGAYVLIPDAGLGNYEDIQNIAKNIFSYAQIKKENAKIEIQNGTGVLGLAQETKIALEAEGYNIIEVTNAEAEDNLVNTIYDLSNGEKPQSLESLKNELNANISTQMPASFSNANVNTNSEIPDFIIVLGANQAKNLNLNN